MIDINVTMIQCRKEVNKSRLATKGITSVSNKDKYEKAMKWRLSSKLFLQMLIAKHSPIEEMIFRIDMVGTERAIQHFVRHEEIGKYVATSRPDIDGHINNDNGMRIASFTINAKRLIEISDQRLCNKAWHETRHIWEEVVRKVIEIEPLFSYVLMKPCEKCGYCVETTGWCGYDYNAGYCLHKKDIEKLYIK